MTAYIYLIRLNGKPKYVGFTSISVDHRWKQHISSSETEEHGCPLLMNGIKKHGVSAFSIETLFEHEDREYTLKTMEPKFIEEYKTFSDWGFGGYNLTTGGDAGCQWSDETKKRLSDKLKGRILSEETKKRLSESRMGMVFSEEHRKNISKSLKGRTPWNKEKIDCYSEDTKKKISNSGKHRFSDPKAREKTSEATKKAMKNPSVIEKMKGRIVSQQTKDKLSEWGKKNSFLIRNNPRKNIKYFILRESGDLDIIINLKDSLNISRNQLQALLQWSKKQPKLKYEGTVKKVDVHRKYKVRVLAIETNGKFVIYDEKFVLPEK